MGRRKYDPEVSAKLEQLAGVHKAHVIAKAELRQQIEMALRDKLGDYELRKSRLMNELATMGAAKTDLGRAIGTANWDTIQNLMARTAEDYAIDQEAATSLWSREGDTVTVRLVAEPWVGVEGGISGNAVYAVTAWDQPENEGRVKLRFVSGDENMRMFEAVRPTGLVQQFVESVFEKNGWNK